MVEFINRSIGMVAFNSGATYEPEKLPAILRRVADYIEPLDIEVFDIIFEEDENGIFYVRLYHSLHDKHDEHQKYSMGMRKEPFGGHSWAAPGEQPSIKP